MAKGMWVGVGAKARKVKKICIGVDGVARKVKKVFIGDSNGRARLVWQDFVMPSYTGTYVIYGDESKGRIELLTSGTLTLSGGVYDVFCVQGGAAGAVPRSTSTGAGGGGGGYTYTRKGITVAPQNATVAIGAGGNPVANVQSGANLAYINEGGATSIFFIEEICTAYQKHLSHGGSTSAGISGIDGGSGGAGCTFSDDDRNGAAGGSDGGGGQGSYSGHGQGTTTRAFGESTNTLYAGGGGGAGSDDPGGPGGAGGGGAGADGGSDGLANTGGGGGGGNSNHKSSFAGGSGIVIVRWGY